MRECRKLVEVGRRQFLRGSGAATAGALAAAVAPSTPARATPAPARITYPSERLANIAELQVNEPFDISYPDANSRACC